MTLNDLELPFYICDNHFAYVADELHCFYCRVPCLCIINRAVERLIFLIALIARLIILIAR